MRCALLAERNAGGECALTSAAAGDRRVEPNTPKSTHLQPSAHTHNDACVGLVAAVSCGPSGHSAQVSQTLCPDSFEQGQVGWLVGVLSAALCAAVLLRRCDVGAKHPLVTSASHFAPNNAPHSSQPTRSSCAGEPAPEKTAKTKTIQDGPENVRKQASRHHT